MKIVIVDDDQDTVDLVKAIGEFSGVEVCGFASGLEALGWLNDNRTDVVLLDLELPVLDGLRIAKEIRKNEELHPGKKPVKMAFVSGHEIDETIRRVAEKVGVEDRYIVQKPFDAAGLITDLKRDLLGTSS